MMPLVIDGRTVDVERFAAKPDGKTEARDDQSEAEEPVQNWPMWGADDQTDSTAWPGI